MRFLCICIIALLVVAAVWGGFYSLHMIHAADYAEHGGQYEFSWADIPVVLTMIGAIVFFVLVGSVFCEDL